MTSVRLVLCGGSSLTLYAVVGEDGSCDAKAWLAGLPQQAQIQFQARFERLCEVGFLRSPEEMRRLDCPGDPKVFEIKVKSGYRLYVVLEGKDWLATHGVKRPKDKHVCRQAMKTRTVHLDYQNRCHPQ
jgi:hypothetical protein